MLVVECLGLDVIGLDNGKRLEKICRRFAGSLKGRSLRQKVEREDCCLATLHSRLDLKRGKASAQREQRNTGANLL